MSIAEGLNPGAQPNRSRQAECWVDYGRALARVRGRHGDAARTLRRAEHISPHRIQREPAVRQVLSELLAVAPTFEARGALVNAARDAEGLGEWFPDDR